MTTFVSLVLISAVGIGLLMAISEAARGGHLKAAWANRAQSWRRIKRAAGTMAYLVLAIHEAAAYANPALSYGPIPRWLRIPMGASFLLWAIRRIAEDVVNSARIEVTITKETQERP